MLSLIKIFVLAQAVLASPLARRAADHDDWQSDLDQTSPVFSLVAFHRGKEFQYNVVKYNGKNLELARDEPAFFGHIEAFNGYALSIPAIAANPYAYDSNDDSSFVYDDTNVTVSSTGLMVAQANQTSSHFGISNSLLTYQNSSKFMACPVWSNKNSTWGMHGPENSTWARDHKNLTALWNRNASIADSYSNATMLYGTNVTANATWLRHFETYNLHAGSKCPNGVPGYELSLIVQLAELLNFSPESNTWADDDSNSEDGSNVFKRLLNLIASK